MNDTTPAQCLTCDIVKVVDPEVTSNADEIFDSPIRKTIEGMIFRHYKGNLYKVIDLALDTVTNKVVVIYKPLYACKYNLFTRPFDEFFGMVEHNNTRILRFSMVRD